MNMKAILILWVLLSFIPISAAVPAEGAPPARLTAHYGQVMFYYPPYKAVVLFGKMSDDPASRVQPWKWNGRTWEPIAKETPPFRAWTAMAYDTRRQRLVVFGGKDKNQKGYPDFWEWDGEEWTTPTGKTPPGRSHHAMAYDESRGRVVLFGGHDLERILGDTWEWDGTEWRQATCPGPPARCLHTMIYDPSRKKIILAGGSGDTENEIIYSDVWEWDGTAWSELKTRNPLKISFHAMVYDGSAGCPLLCGGFASSHDPTADSWWLRDGEWRKAEPGLPMPLEALLAAFDPEHKQTVLFGGFGGAKDKYPPNEKTWVWDGQKWTGY